MDMLRPGAAEEASPVSDNPNPPVVTLISPAEFFQTMVDDYNFASQEEFRSRFSPRAAEFDGIRILKPRDGGSFWIVRSTVDGSTFCVPRPRKITATLHENIGLKNLFQYAGYNPAGREQGFRLEAPAEIVDENDGSWVVRQMGRLVVTSDGAQ
jgi:hypothetical protein